jgi:hypothetical protein
MPSIRHSVHKSTDTSKKNIELNDQMGILLRELLAEYGRDNLLLWREVYKRDYLGVPSFKDDIEKGKKALPKDLVKRLDQELSSKRRKTMFFRVLEKKTGVRKLYDIDHQIEMAKKNS